MDYLKYWTLNLMALMVYPKVLLTNRESGQMMRILLQVQPFQCRSCRAAISTGDASQKPQLQGALTCTQDALFHGHQCFTHPHPATATICVNMFGPQLLKMSPQDAPHIGLAHISWPALRYHNSLTPSSSSCAVLNQLQHTTQVLANAGNPKSATMSRVLNAAD